MQGLTEDELLQSKVGSLIDAARGRDIETIAERVEDANTMAVLWQLGVQHLQGFLIQAPEEVDHQHQRDADRAGAAGQPGPARGTQVATLPAGPPCGSCATAPRRAARARRGSLPAPSS